MPGFQRFVKFNMVDDNCLKLAVQNINLVRVPKDEYIFREGSRTKEFFGIIKGVIAIRKRKPSYEENIKNMIKKKQIIKEINHVMRKFNF